MSKIANFAFALAVVLTIVEAAARGGSDRVPGQATAVAIARVALIPIYGQEQIQSEEPLVAQRHGDVWIVRGTLNCGLSWWDRLWGGMCLGGTAEIRLSAKDGHVLHVTHYK